MDKLTGIILTVTGFLCGAIIGFILSPVKKGIRVGDLSVECNIGSNNGNGSDNFEKEGDSDEWSYQSNGWKKKCKKL